MEKGSDNSLSKSKNISIANLSDEEEESYIDNQLSCAVNKKADIQRNGTNEQCITKEPVICNNCTMSYEDLKAYEDHLFNDKSCFFPMSQRFWYKNSVEKQLCIICHEMLPNQLMLKKHCFENVKCRQEYIYLCTGKCKQPKKLKNMTEESKSNNTVGKNSICNLVSQDSNNNVACTATNLLSQVRNKTDISPLTKKELSVKYQSVETSTEKAVRASSQTQLEHSRTTVLTLTAQNNLFNGRAKKQLRSKSNLTCEGCGQQFTSMEIKEKHIDASIECSNQIINKNRLCLFCKVEFSSEQEKIDHLKFTRDCQQNLREVLINGKFLDKRNICENYNSDTKMCPCCLFTFNNVIDHLLNVQKCRNEFEDAVVSYNEQIANIEFTVPTTHETGTLEQQFPCNICSRNFSKLASLKSHKIKTHKESSEHNRHNSRQKQSVGNSYHLYCFTCRKFLKTESQMENHPCKPTRLLSRSCFIKAVWKEGEYECKNCTKFFSSRIDLEKHMYIHDKKTSPLFKYVPSSFKQKKIPVKEGTFVVANKSTLETVSFNGINNMNTDDVLTTFNSSCINNTRSYENSNHEKMSHCSGREQSTSEAEASIYQCNICRLTFLNLKEFVLHTSLKH